MRFHGTTERPEVMAVLRDDGRTEFVWGTDDRDVSSQPGDSVPMQVIISEESGPDVRCAQAMAVDIGAVRTQRNCERIDP